MKFIPLYKNSVEENATQHRLHPTAFGVGTEQQFEKNRAEMALLFAMSGGG